MDPVTGGLISGGIKLLGGLFGGKKKSPTPAQNMLSQAKGARQAAEKYGFNPLTMLQYGQPGGAMGAGGAPPLASSDLILGAMQDVSDVLTGETARRAEANKLELELGRRKIEAMSGLLAVAPSAAATVGEGLPTIGRRAAMAVTPSTQLRFPDANFASGNPRLSDPVVLPDGSSGGVGIPERRLDRGSGSYWGGVLLAAAPGWSDGQTIEDNDGDGPVSWVHGVAKLASDVGYTAGGAIYDWQHHTPMDKPPKHRPPAYGRYPVYPKFGFGRSY